MFRITLLLALVIFFQGCQKQEEKPSANSTTSLYKVIRHLPQQAREKQYSQLLDRIKTRQKAFQVEYSNASNQKKRTLEAMAARYLVTTITDSIFPYWFGTTWDYNGTTETPGKGAIACGYFITTTMRDCGIQLPRIKLAQQAASIIINTVCNKNSLRVIGQNDTDKLERHLLAQDDGLYVIGLDNHVAFISKSGSELYAIHSNGLRGSQQVEKEKLRDCGLIMNSTNFYVANIFSNDRLITKWIQHQPLSIAYN